MKAALIPALCRTVGRLSAIDVKCHLKLVALPARKSVSISSSCSAAFCFRFGALTPRGRPFTQVASIDRSFSR